MLVVSSKSARRLHTSDRPKDVIDIIYQITTILSYFWRRCSTAIDIAYHKGQYESAAYITKGEGLERRSSILSVGLRGP
jgi:hypothetical protein